MKPQPTVSRYSRKRQAGVTLAILLWFLAALSVLAAGIAYQARVDVKLAQLHRELAEVKAAADGAIQLAMAIPKPTELGGETPSPVRRGVYRVGRMQVTVLLYPASGLISLNRAKPELLGMLFRSAGMPAPQAQQLALNVIEWRTPRTMANRTKRKAQWPRGYEPRNGRFEAIEDLMLVYGANRELFEKVRDSIYVGQLEQDGVDWQVAPPQVLQTLAGGDADVARAVAASRDQGSYEGEMAPAEINSKFQGAGLVPLIRADATVTAGGKTYLRRRWVDESRIGTDGLPWHYTRTEPVRSYRG